MTNSDDRPSGGARRPDGKPGRIDGVFWGRMTRHVDDRGALREVYRASWSDKRFVQANVSSSRAGVLRGLHLHRRQLDCWIVLNGRVFVALVDPRPILRGEAGRPAVETWEIHADQWVVIPAGVAHGFYAIEETDLLYLVTNEFDGTDELGFAWDDPYAGVPWPTDHPILSARDRANPPLQDLLRSIT